MPPMAEVDGSADDATYRVQYLVTGGSAFTTVVSGDAVVEQIAGDDQEAADLVVTLSKADAAAVGSGELKLDAGFMQGRVKIVGSMGTVMTLLPLLRSPEYGAVIGAGATAG